MTGSIFWVIRSIVVILCGSWNLLNNRHSIDLYYDSTRGRRQELNKAEKGSLIKYLNGLSMGSLYILNVIFLATVCYSNLKKNP